MSVFVNELGQAIGAPMAGWQGCKHPRGAKMEGRFCQLRPVDPQQHASDLFAAFAEDRDAYNWTYLPYGPFATEKELRG